MDDVVGGRVSEMQKREEFALAEINNTLNSQAPIRIPHQEAPIRTPTRNPNKK